MRHITHQRNRDFINQCKKSATCLWFRGRKPTFEEIVAHALKQPAPSYYVSYYRATSILKQMLKTPGRRGRYASSRQWDDMAADLKRMMERRPGVSLRRLVLELCTGMAGSPRFYLSSRRARQIAAEALTQKTKAV